MLVARSFNYSPPRESHLSSAGKTRLNKQEKKPKPTRGFGWRPASYEDHALQFKSVESTSPASPLSTSPTSSLQPEMMAKRSVAKVAEQQRGMLGQEISSSRSHPLEIPRRDSPETLRAPPTSRRKTSRQSSRSGPDAANGHDPRALPPSMAALLAMTSIPRKKTFPPSRPSTLSRSNMSSQALVEQWKQLDLDDDAAVDPTMELLLSPPCAEDMLARTFSSESLSDSFSRSRSCSTESMISLEGDACASWSMPSTPASPRRADLSSGTKERSVLFPTSIDSVIDHPLLPLEDTDSFFSDSGESTPVSSPPRSPSPPTSRQPLGRPQPKSSASKSTLSLSLKALRSAAQSFANFAAPSLTVLPDDHLSRGLFPRGNMTYPSEMRPKPLDGVPTAEMRRYMNPSHRLAPGDFHLHGASWDHVDLEAAAAAGVPVAVLTGVKEGPQGPGVIKLHTYTRGGRDKRAAAQRSGNTTSTSSPKLVTVSPFAALEPASESGPSLREALPHTTHTRPRREARENADFLRVCVLEMSMRRAGKLEAVEVGGGGQGKARFWLPPRTDLVAAEEVISRPAGKAIPKRWLSEDA